MKSSMRNRAKGRLHELKGTAKEAVGRLTKDRELEAEGAVERTRGKAQKKVGQIERVLGR